MKSDSAIEHFETHLNRIPSRRLPAKGQRGCNEAGQGGEEERNGIEQRCTPLIRVMRSDHQNERMKEGMKWKLEGRHRQSAK